MGAGELQLVHRCWCDNADEDAAAASAAVGAWDNHRLQKSDGQAPSLAALAKANLLSWLPAVSGQDLVVAPVGHKGSG